MANEQSNGRYTTIRTTVWGRLARMGLSRLARLIMAELLHGDLRANVKSGIFWPCGPAIIASIMQEPEEEVVAAMKELEEAGCLKTDMALWIVWLRELWLHEWIANPKYAIAISREMQPMPPGSHVWPDALGIFKALHDQVANNEDLKERAKWYEPILSVIESKIDPKANNIETAIKESYTWLIHVSNTCIKYMYQEHVSDTCIKYMYQEHVPDTTYYLQPATYSLQPATNNLQPAKDIKDKGRFQASACVTKTFESFLTQYKKATGKEHPGISPSEKENVLERLERIYANFAEVTNAKPKLAMQITMKQFFDDWKAGSLKAEDPTIWLFLTPEVWRMRAFRAGIVDAESVFNRADGSVLGEEG